MTRLVLRYTQHAEDSIVERELDRNWIERTVADPDWRVADPRNPGVERRFRAIPEFDGRILRVACLENEGEICTLTASSAKIVESAEVSPDVIFDYDRDGRIVGIELLNAKEQLPSDTLTKAA